MRRRSQREQAAIGIDCVSPAGVYEFEGRFLAPIEQTLANATIRPKYQVQGVGAEARYLDDLGNPARIEAAQARPRLYVFEGQHHETVYPDRREVANSQPTLSIDLGRSSNVVESA